MNPPDSVRADKWLWAVRLFKTRTTAAQACRAGHVKIDGEPIKPARPVRVNQLIHAQIGELSKTVRVAGLIEQRVSATRAKEFVEDLTPPEEYERIRRENGRRRETGAQRPTKKDRRSLAKMRDWLERNNPSLDVD